MPLQLQLCLLPRSSAGPAACSRRLHPIPPTQDALERARRASSGEGASTRSGSGAAAAPAPELTNVAAVQRRNRGLKSSLEIEEQLKNFWYPVEFVAVSAQG